MKGDARMTIHPGNNDDQRKLAFAIPAAVDRDFEGKTQAVNRPLASLLQEPGVREILEAAPDALVIVNRQGQIVSANAATLCMFGYTLDEIFEQPVELFLPEHLRNVHRQHRAQYDSNPHRRPMGAGAELTGLHKDGTEFPVEISLSPLVTKGELFVISAIRDVTLRKRFEQALQEKNIQLERASRARDLFLAGMSHELRTPLNAILGFTGTLLMQLPGSLNQKQQDQLKIIKSSASHLLTIINDLLIGTQISSDFEHAKDNPAATAQLAGKEGPG